MILTRRRRRGFSLYAPMPSLSYQPAGRLLWQRWKQISVFWQLRVLLLESVCHFLLDVLKYFIFTFQTRLFELLWKVPDFRTASFSIMKFLFFSNPPPVSRSHSLSAQHILPRWKDLQEIKVSEVFPNLHPEDKKCRQLTIFAISFRILQLTELSFLQLNLTQIFHHQYFHHDQLFYVLTL